MFAKLKQKWREFLARLAKENEEQFGDEKLDCCNLNKIKEK